MSGKNRGLTLERAQTAERFRCTIRLEQAIADVKEGQAMHNRVLARVLESMDKQLGGIEAGLAALATDVRAVGGGQSLIANRIEGAFRRWHQTERRIGRPKDAPFEDVRDHAVEPHRRWLPFSNRCSLHSSAAGCAVTSDQP